MIISIASQKGGVGKTTLATHIAAGLAVKGHRVVLVDSDPQGHATVALGLPKEPGLYDLLVRDASFKPSRESLAVPFQSPRDLVLPTAAT